MTDIQKRVMIYPCCKKPLPAPLDGVESVICPCGIKHKSLDIIEFNRKYEDLINRKYGEIYETPYSYGDELEDNHD